MDGVLEQHKTPANGSGAAVEMAGSVGAGLRPPQAANEKSIHRSSPVIFRFMQGSFLG
ncbi:MAG: hypothetical protein IPL28_03120 [Chloroflexi bacterium]|nr:hypothetical protein [Chloroflexota bacterium]